MKPGIYTAAELSNEEYHGGGGVSSTTLKELISRSPAHCKAMMDGLRRKSSTAMALGTVVHSAVLEPDLFASTYFVPPVREEYPDALETSAEYLAAVEAAGLDLSAKTSRAAIRAALDLVEPGLVYWEDLAAAAPTKEKYPDALDSVAQFKDACQAFSVNVPPKSTKQYMRESLVFAKADVVFWDDLAAQVPKKADHPEALDSVADYRLAAETLGVDLSAKSTKAAMRLELEKAGAPVVFWEDLIAVPEGMAAISREQADVAAGIAAAVRRDSDAAYWLTGGVSEQSFVWTDALTGELCKARTDHYLESEGFLADLKTCQDCRPEAVARDIAKYGYDVSAAMYLEGVRAAGKPSEAFVWVFVEILPPYALRCYVASPALLKRALNKYYSGLEQFSLCRLADHWPSYPAGLVEIDVPRWASIQDENNEINEVA